MVKTATKTASMYIRIDQEPNAETLEAIEEVRRMKADPSLCKGYTDIDEMMKELLE